MSKLNLSIKQNLKKQIEQENNKGNDTRLLNYWDLKDGEKMTILFIPDANGELWTKFSKHGPNLKVNGSGSINCSYKSNGMDCPACQKGFDYLNLSRETGDKEQKEEAKRWFSKDYTLTQCLVLESPMEISESPDGNQVKLMYLPFAVENVIKEAVTEGLVPEDEICSTPFVIKKTKNQGGWASYENSYFSRKQIADEELEVFEEFKIEQYDFDDLDIVPDPTTTQEVQEWLDKATKLVEGSNEGDGQGKKESSQGGLKDRIQQSRESSKEKETDNEDTRRMNDDIPSNDSDDQESEEPQPASRGSSLRERLSAARRS